MDAAAAELEKAFSDGISAARLRLNEIAELINSGQGTEITAALDTLRGPLTVIHFSMRGTTVLPDHDLLYLPVPVEPKPLLRGVRLRCIADESEQESIVDHSYFRIKRLAAVTGGRFKSDTVN